MAAATCPIPLPPGSANGTFFGPNRPSLFPTLDDLSGNDLLDGQIITELRNTQCTNGISFDSLLASLQTNYPESDWTDTLLSGRLSLGRKRGRFCLANNGTYVIRKNMVQLDFKNIKFQGLSNLIIKVYDNRTTVADNHGGVYKGFLPICGQATCGTGRFQFT